MPRYLIIGKLPILRSFICLWLVAFSALTPGVQADEDGNDGDRNASKESAEPQVRNRRSSGGTRQRGSGQGTGEGRSRRERSGRTFPPVLSEEFIKTKLPSGVRYLSDIDFKAVDNTELKLDVLLPKSDSKSMPIAVWIHGGAWMRGNKAQDLHRFDQLTSRVLQEGIAFASIEYRLSGQAQFPDPAVDCNDAIAFLHRNRKRYGIDTDRLVVMGTSAGGHLASLLGTSTTSSPERFLSDGTSVDWTLRGIVNFYGPSDLVHLQKKRGNIDPQNDNSPEARFLGKSPLKHPELAKSASPVAYVGENSPPFLIFHGDEDRRVPIDQSELLNAALTKAGVDSRLVVVKGARHGDHKFDETVYNDDVIEFLHRVLK